VYVMVGSIEDRHLLFYDQQVGRSGSRAAADLSRFAWQYGPMDRDRPPVGCHVARTHSLYDLRVSRLFSPLRTFALDAHTAPGRTVWTDLLVSTGEVREEVSDGELARRRGRLFGAQHLTGSDRVAKDLGYSVLADAWPVGNGRCGKRGHATHMLCDICYRVYGLSVRETTRHIVLDCRQTELFLDVVWRAVIEATNQDYNAVKAARERPLRVLLRRAACPLVTGCSPPQMQSNEPFLTLVRAVQSELWRMRCVNAMSAGTGLVQFSVSHMYRAVRARLLQAGAHRQRAAIAWETELRLRHPGWEPGEDGPVRKWEREWLHSGFLTGGDGRLRCGLLADPLSVPGAAFAAADVRVCASLQLWPAQGGDVRVRVLLRPIELAVISAPSVRVKFGQCRRPHVALG